MSRTALSLTKTCPDSAQLDLYLSGQRSAWFRPDRTVLISQRHKYCIIFQQFFKWIVFSILLWQRSARLSAESRLSAVPDSTQLWLSAVPDSTQLWLRGVPDSTQLWLSAVPDSTQLLLTTVPDRTQIWHSAAPDSSKPGLSAVPDSTQPRPSAVPDSTQPRLSAVPDSTQPWLCSVPDSYESRGKKAIIFTNLQKFADSLGQVEKKTRWDIFIQTGWATESLMPLYCTFTWIYGHMKMNHLHLSLIMIRRIGFHFYPTNIKS